MARLKNQSIRSRVLRTRTRLLATAVSACFAATAHGAATGITPTYGTLTSSQIGNIQTITTYQSFTSANVDRLSIAPQEKLIVDQLAGASSTTLFRVLYDPSVILGTLTSNGKVFLINPNGIMVGAGARIDVAGFVASTLNITDANFLANKLKFDATPGAGSVVNNGTITTPSGGTVYLVAPNVTNNGIITTPQGETILAAGQTVTLLDTGTPGVSVEITGAEGNATNLGTIVADAGRIGIAGVLVKNSGTLSASSAVSQGGKIFLKASQDAYVDGDGRIVTTGTKGGKVEVLGNRVAVMDNASIDASGTNGGGTVLIGGDLQGKNLDVQNATVTYFGPNASIKANATNSGNGGKVIVWSNDLTRAYGNIEARGGLTGGNGGFVEISGHYLDFHATVDRLAPKGKNGVLLLDPADVTITYGGSTSGISSTSGVFYGGSTGTGTKVDWYDINNGLNSGDVYITTNGGSNAYAGNITIQTSTNYSSNYGGALKLFANNNINASGVTMSLNGGLEMYAGWDGTFSGPVGVAGSTPNAVVTNGVGDIVLTSSSHFSSNGTVKLKAGRDVLFDNSSVSGNILSQVIAARDISLINSSHIYSGYNGNAIVNAGNSLSLSGGGISAGNVSVSAKNISIDSGGYIVGDHSVSVTASGLLSMYGGYIGGYAYDGVTVNAGRLEMYSGAGISTNDNCCGAGHVTVYAGSILMDNSHIEGYSGVTVVSKGDVTLRNGSDIFGYYGGTSVIAGGDVSLSGYSVGGYSYRNDGSYIGSDHGGVSILARNLTLSGYSGVYSSDANPASTVDIIVQGNITLGDASGPGQIFSGSDINLTLNGPDSVVSLQSGGGYGTYGSFIWSDAYQGVSATTTINFNGRSSGGVFVDGVATTTTTAYGGYPYYSPTSGFFGGPSAQPSVLNADLIINYGSPSNIATQTIDQFFSNLTDEKKKKGTDNSTDKGNPQNEQKDSNVGQCV